MQAWVGVVVKISHRLGIKENDVVAPHVSPKRVLDLDYVGLSPPQTSEGLAGWLDGESSELKCWVAWLEGGQLKKRWPSTTALKAQLS